MKAIRIHQYGGPEQLVLEEVPRPEIADDEVLVRVWAAGVNPVDWKVRQGYLSEFLGHHLPLAAAAEAQREGEAGHMQGKLVLRIE